MLFDIFDFDTISFRRSAILQLRNQPFNRFDSLACALH